MGAIAVTASLVLSGCTLIQELQGTDEELEQGTGAEGGEGSGDIPDSVAPGAEEFYEQEVEWGECPPEYAAEDETVECATVIAPLNWADPTQESDYPVELALVRLPATGESQGSLFTNPGGPGGSGVDFVAQSGSYMFSEDLRENFDIVGWDPRGVGYSSAVYCYDDEGMDDYLYGVPDGYSEMTTAELLDYQKKQAIAFGDACYENTGELLEYVDTISTVQDLDLLRYVIDGAPLNYFGFSYGTDIGAQYIDMFPEQVGRVVLDGATDPTVPMMDVVLDQQEKFSDSILAYLEDCLTGDQCPFDKRGGVDGAIEEIQDVMDDADTNLSKGPDGRVVTSALIYQAIVAGMYDESSWQYVSNAFESWMTSRDSTIFFALADSYNGRLPDGTYMSNQTEAFTAINCLDYPVETDKAKIREYNEKLQEVTLFSGEASDEELELGDVTCENWPFQSRLTEQAPVVGEGAAPVLVVATTNDPATPLKWAEAVAEQLESASLLVYEGEGHIAYDEGDECVIGTVDDYLITGNLPEGDINC
jgi:pimeloyl-ACP methyl ester carboxylesterase